MKKMLYTFMAIVTCSVLLTGCSFFAKPGDTTREEIFITSDTENDTQEATTEDEGEEIPVGNPENASSEDTTEDDKNDTSNDESSNPRDNVASDSSKEYQATGKYCGFIDSISVEVEMEDGSYCSFFVYEEDVKSTLSALNEEDMPEISFTYKARTGQVNPEMTSVIGG